MKKFKFIELKKFLEKNNQFVNSAIDENEIFNGINSLNLSSENEINIHNLILNISNKMSWDGDLKMMKNRDSDVLRHKGCSKKLRNLIKYQLTDFNKALDETISWFRNNKSKNV